MTNPGALYAEQSEAEERGRSDSRLKWLLNERAALVGKLVKFEEQIRVLEGE